VGKAETFDERLRKSGLGAASVDHGVLYDESNGESRWGTFDGPTPE